MVPLTPLMTNKAYSKDELAHHSEIIISASSEPESGGQSVQEFRRKTKFADQKDPEEANPSPFARMAKALLALGACQLP